MFTTLKIRRSLTRTDAFSVGLLDDPGPWVTHSRSRRVFFTKTSRPQLPKLAAVRGSGQNMHARQKSAGLGRLFIVAAFAAGVAFAGLFSLPPLDRDEARFAQATAQMLETGDFIAIRFQDRERNKKPAGIYWLQAASVSAFSSVEDREIWAYRIPSLIGVIFAAIFTYLGAARLYDRRCAFLAGLLIASAPVIAAEATIAKTDGVLLALISLAQLAFIHIYAAARENRTAGWRWPVLFWAAQGAGILVKGPIAPVVSFFTGLGLMTAKPRFTWLKSMRLLTGVLILTLILAPWAVAINHATEGRFFADAIGGDMLGKVGEAQESHAAPPGYHAALVWFLFWPASALILPGLMHIWRDRNFWQARFLLSWLIPAWLVFEIAATKLPHYVMPLYPALAIIAAHAAVRGAGTVSWPQKTGAVIFGLVGLVAAGLVAVLPIVYSEASITPLCFSAAALIALGSILIAILFWRGRAYEGGVAAAMLAALYAWTLMTGVLPGLSKLAVSPRLSTALEIAERHPLHHGLPPVALAGYSEPSAIFLLGTETALTTGAEAGRRLLSGAVSAAIVEQRMAADFQTAVTSKQDEIRALAVIDGLNYSNGKSVALTIYVRDAAN